MKEHSRKLFMTFIWVIIVRLTSWIGIHVKAMAEREA